MKRIGILGGTFDPVHNGHLILAQEVKQKLHLDMVYFVPAFIPPHKRRKIIPIVHRLAMLECAIDGQKDFIISDYEISLQRKCYTYETLTYFNEQFPNAKIFFIAGTDNIPFLDTWKNLELIFSLSTFIVGSRPGYPLKKINDKVRYITIASLHVSSSELRKRIKTGKDIKYLVPDEVIRYIYKNRLYQ